MYRNIDKQKKLMLKDLVEYQDGQVVSKTLVQNDLVSMTVFSFDKGEEISSHSAGGDAMVTVLEGVGRFTVDGEVFILGEGETLIMPKGIPHAVFGGHECDRPGFPLKEGRVQHAALSAAKRRNNIYP